MKFIFVVFISSLLFLLAGCESLEEGGIGVGDNCLGENCSKDVKPKGFGNLTGRINGYDWKIASGVAFVDPLNGHRLNISLFDTKPNQNPCAAVGGAHRIFINVQRQFGDYNIGTVDQVVFMSYEGGRNISRPVPSGQLSLKKQLGLFLIGDLSVKINKDFLAKGSFHVRFCEEQ